MAKQPLGKTLLRNVIRHTYAHNKIQEEMEMWKMRDWEVQKSQPGRLPATEGTRGSMHCDRVPDHSRDLSQSRECMSEARYWTRKLHELEKNDPERWGHSGFEELHPEEFKSDSERETGQRRAKKSKSSTGSGLSKRAKKSSRKKKKKKKKRKDEGGKRKKGECSSSERSSDESGASREKQRRKRTKNRHKNKKAAKSRDRDEDSGAGGSEEDGDKPRGRRGRKRQKHDSGKDSDLGLDPKKKRRKDWRAAGEESSDDSSGD